MKDDADAPEFPPFSVTQLIQTGNHLLASSGQEFIKPASLDTPAEVEKARKEAMGRLGLGFLETVDGGDWQKELVDSDLDVKMEEQEDNDEDMDVKPSTSSKPPAKPTLKTDVKSDDGTSIKSPTSNRGSQLPSTPLPEIDTTGLSAREINRLKRKRKPGNTAFVSAPPPTVRQPPPGQPPSK